MPTTFTSGNDTYVVSAAGTYDLEFLGGDDKLTVQGGDSTTADMGDGNDLVQIKSGIAIVSGGAGADKFDIWSPATVDGGADNDTINIRGGPNISAAGGIGDDRFNVYADTLGLSLDGGGSKRDTLGLLVTAVENGSSSSVAARTCSRTSSAAMRRSGWSVR